MICIHLLHDELQCFCLITEYLRNNILHPSRIKIYFRVNPKFPDYHVEEDSAVKAGTRINTSVTDANWYNDAAQIDFKYPRHLSQVRTAYSSLLDNKLILRKMYRNCSYSVEIKQKYLRLSIHNGNNVITTRRIVDKWCQVDENGKIIDVNDAVLCILHLELRCSENKIGNLFNEGFVHRRQPAVIKEYTQKIEDVVNKGKIEKSTHQNQWSFPINKENNVLLQPSH